MCAEIFTSLRGMLNEKPFLIHASNVLKKYDDRKHINELNCIVQEYIRYLNIALNTHGIDEQAISSKVTALNSYYNFLHQNEYDNLYPSQSKFRSTILEEFMGLLFFELVSNYQQQFHVNNDVLNCGPANAYTNLFFTGANFQDFVASPSIGINSKNQDFAIYRQTELTINDVRKKICLPIVALENKTYIDKTMLEGSIATAEKIKSGNPYCLFCIVTETYEVSFDVDPAYSRIDQIFVLRKSSLRNEFQHIDFHVVYNLVSLINSHLERQWSNVEQRMLQNGTIIYK